MLGPTLVFYWLFTPWWKAKAWFLSLQLLWGSLLLIVWVVVLLYACLRQTQQVQYIEHNSLLFSPFAHAIFYIKENPWQDRLANTALVILKFLLVILTVFNPAINLSDLFRRYLSDDVDDQGRQLDEALRGGFIAAISEILGKKSYRRVTVLAHSFGAAIAVDAFASGKISEIPNIDYVKLVTLGGFLYVLGLRSQAFSCKVKHCLNRPELLVWEEFWSPKDPLSNPTEKPRGASGKLISREALVDLKLTDLLRFAAFVDPTDTAHSRYFQDENLLASIVT